MLGLRITCGVSAVLVLLAGSPAVGQRVQFPSAIPTNTAPAPASGAPYGTVPANPAPIRGSATSPYGAPTAPSYGSGTAPLYSGGTAPGSTPSTPPGYAPGTAPTYAPSTTPGYAPSTAPSFAPSTTPGYAPGTAPAYAPGTAPSYGPGLTPGPTATFQGGIQAAPSFDPYATPGLPPATLFPQDPTVPVFPGQPSNTFTTMTRFLQEIRMEYVWIPGTASNEFGANDVDLTATFAIPFLCNPQTPLLITPGFAFHFWNGPVTPPPPPPVDLPALPGQVYDAYLEAAWHPQVSRVLSGDLAFSVGVYSDFTKLINESIRYQGHGYGIVALSPSFQIKAGVIYLDRNRFKLFPAGGIIWTPNDDVRFEILFPNPKLAFRLPGYGSTEWWFYARGEYGGGAWTLKPSPAFPDPVEVDYNDMRAAVGLDFKTIRGLEGLVEVGITFEREIFYPSVAPAPATPPFTFRPDPMVFVGAGLAY